MEIDVRGIDSRGEDVFSVIAGRWYGVTSKNGCRKDYETEGKDNEAGGEQFCTHKGIWDSKTRVPVFELSGKGNW